MINKQDRRKKPYSETVHHILPRSLGGSNKRCNKIRLYQPIHESLHRLFGNMDIKGQINQLIKINQRALNPEFVEELRYILKSERLEYYYKQESYKKRRE